MNLFLVLGERSILYLIQRAYQSEVEKHHLKRHISRNTLDKKAVSNNGFFISGGLYVFTLTHAFIIGRLCDETYALSKRT